MKTWNWSKIRSYVLLPGLVLGLVMGGCGKHPKTFSPTGTDTFTFDSIDTYAQAGALYQADYLVMFDPSYSFLANKSVLESSIKAFTAKLRSEGIDYRVGFVNGNVQSNCPSRDTNIGACAPNLDFLGGILTPAMGPSAEDQVVSKIAVPLAHNWPVPLELADKILKAKGSSFLRPAAQLVIVFISDSDDKSNVVGGVSGSTTPTGYAAKLKAYKSNAGYVSSRAIVYGVSSGCPAQGSPGTSTGTRIAQAASATDHVGTNVVQCITSNFAQSLENLAINVTVPTNRFVLQNRAVPGTVQVYVGGMQEASANYIFSTSSNEVVFSAGQEPPLGAHVELRYEPVLTLSKAPHPDTITVFVNGSEVPRNATNGFTYIAGENRIMLWGSAAVQNADVRVSYQLAH